MWTDWNYERVNSTQGWNLVLQMRLRGHLYIFLLTFIYSTPIINKITLGDITMYNQFNHFNNIAGTQSVPAPVLAAENRAYIVVPLSRQ